jgi:hypothetical protein
MGRQKGAKYCGWKCSDDYRNRIWRAAHSTRKQVVEKRVVSRDTGSNLLADLRRHRKFACF